MENLSFEQLKIGQEASFERVFSVGDINKFAEMTGDYNPLHTDNAYAREAGFGGQIIHGILAGSLF